MDKIIVRPLNMPRKVVETVERLQFLTAIIGIDLRTERALIAMNLARFPFMAQRYGSLSRTSELFISGVQSSPKMDFVMHK
jgi:hypothetical protein